MPRWLVLITMLLTSPALAQQAVHGENSIFVSPTVKLGWAVKRGASETETLVIVRVVAIDASYRVVRVVRVVRADGVDPFTKDHKVFVAARPLERETDIAIARARNSPIIRAPSFISSRVPRMPPRTAPHSRCSISGCPTRRRSLPVRARRMRISAACSPSGSRLAAAAG